MNLVRTNPHLWYMLVGLSSVTGTLTPYGWYHGTTAGPLTAGPHTGISIWRRVMCSIARLSRMPVHPDTGCLKSFGDSEGNVFWT